jgi:predicted nucleotidyltransferase
LSRFDFLGTLRRLADHDVRYVLIGGLGARLHGSTTVTNDIDICYARDDENLERLASALRSLHARLRGVDHDVPFILDARTLREGERFTFVTDTGSLDILGTPTGTNGFDELFAESREVDLGGFTVRVASLDDLIRMKRASGRPKDLIEVEVLGALRDEVERGTRAGRRRTP